VDGDSSDDSLDSSNEDLSKPIILAKENSEDSMDEDNESNAVPAFQKKPTLLKGHPVKRMGQSSNSLNATMNSPVDFHDMNCMEINFQLFDQI
jgi:hypothetical protein